MRANATRAVNISRAFDLLSKPPNPTLMPTLVVSSKGQIVLPAPMRRRLGLDAGAKLEVTLEADGLRLTVVRGVAAHDVSALAGMVTAPSRGESRRLSDFDPAILTRRR
jgi:antitoxin PrlF